jgi:hypothetical protein
MENWLNFILQSNLFLGLFFGFYWLLLRRETFFQWNRLYLLASLLISLSIPWMPTPEFVQQTEIVQNVRELNPLPINPIITPAPTVALARYEYTWQDYLWLVYGLGVIALLSRFLLSLILLVRLAIRQGIRRRERVFWVNLPSNNPTFSFLNILFWGNPSGLSTEEQSQILRHELVHIRQWHSLDILFLEVVRAFYWYNPIIWLYQSSLRQVHEYLADQATIQAGADKTDYAHLLVNQTLSKESLHLSNSFYHSKLLKSRIMMLNQVPSANLKRLKFAMILPTLLICLLITWACSEENIPNDPIFSIKELQNQTNFRKPQAGDIVYANTDFDVPEYKRFEQIKVQPKKEYQLKLDKGITYYFKFNDSAGKMVEKEKLQGVVVNIHNANRKLIATNYTDSKLIPNNPNKMVYYPTVRFTCLKTGVYTISFKLDNPSSMPEFYLEMSKK